MNFSEFIKKAKTVLREDAGSEGTAYKVKYTGELKEEGFKVKDKANGEATIEFDYPRDYGYAAQTLKDLGIEIKGLELLY